MSANVGLSTPRGSGTSGYVQRNLSALRPRDVGYGAPYPPKDHLPPGQRKPDQDILDHDRKRDIEVKVLELHDKLEDESKLTEDEIDEECDKLRKKLLAELEMKKGGGSDGKGLKMHQVHELAEVKIRESERLRKALGLKGDEVESDASEHPMARQERRKREEEGRREQVEVERLERQKTRENEREKEHAKDARDRSRERDRDRRRDRR